MTPGIHEFTDGINRLHGAEQAIVARAVIAHLWLEMPEQRERIEAAMHRVLSFQNQQRQAAAAAGTTQGEK